jgi:hypothetical protein
MLVAMIGLQISVQIEGNERAFTRSLRLEIFPSLAEDYLGDCGLVDPKLIRYIDLSHAAGTALPYLRYDLRRHLRCPDLSTNGLS